MLTITKVSQGSRPLYISGYDTGGNPIYRVAIRQFNGWWTL